MKRRAFIINSGKLLVYAPIVTTALSVVSCKKQSVAPGSSGTSVPPKTTDTTPPLPPGVVRTLGPGEGGNIRTLPNNYIADGYTDKQSYLPGDYCTVFLNANSAYTNQKLGVNDINNVLAFSIPISKVNKQQMQADSPSVNGYGYNETVTMLVPSVRSGVYLIAGSIPLIIKSASANVDFTVVYPTNTENAYCLSGGSNLYQPRVQQVSFLRPIPLSNFAGGFFKWIAKQSYICNVIADIDADVADNLKGKLLILPGHSEYWTRTARENFDAHVNSGKPALVLSGNTMYWQARYNSDGNQLTCYKSPVLDTTPNPLDKTILWTDPTLQFPANQSIGADSYGGGYGGTKSSKSFQGIKIAYPASPLFKGLNLKRGDVINCPSHELDGMPVSGTDADGFPIIDNSKLGFSQVKLIGYDLAADYFKPNKFNTSTAVVFQKTETSGVVINMASTNWCTSLHLDTPDDTVIPVVTKNAIDILLHNGDAFA